MIPTSYTIKKDRNSMAGLSAYENGGKGSGNWGHAGRPGKVGGSGSGMSVGHISEYLDRAGLGDRDNGGRLKEYQDKLREVEKAIKDPEYRDEHYFGLDESQLEEYRTRLEKDIKRETERIGFKSGIERKRML